MLSGKQQLFCLSLKVLRSAIWYCGMLSKQRQLPFGKLQCQRKSWDMLDISDKGLPLSRGTLNTDYMMG